MLRTFLYLGNPQKSIIDENNQQYKQRLQNKIRLTIKKELELLALYSKKAAETLHTPPLNGLH